ncbi:RNA-binding S4 domain-containing protein [Vibrio agarivorans]|uniref:RNA-binding S4 domain-containing protein n=1 Tax=Vibrio agarivorans TaxID=153622 RepID=UPI002231F3AB|nr:RNA-binding S4 domain-containing protein [Vibrio agarivorans]MDN3659971.1 RNA-binding S4 domain-containing protein [Vibrio agarivorans]
MEEEYQEEIEIEAIGVEVSSQPIELYKVLKLANVVDGGGQAKHYIAEGYVAVNGELEVRKRRKMYDGDFLEFNQEYYVVVCDQPPIEEVEQPKAQVQPKAEKKRNEKKAKQSQSRASSNKPAEKTNSETSAEQDKPKKSSGGRGEINFF